MRDSEIKALKYKISNENHEIDRSLKDLNEQGELKKQSMEEKHKDEVVRLEKQITTLSKKLADLKKRNRDDEVKAREQMKKADLAYHDNINTYDQEMNDNMNDLNKAKNNYDQTYAELQEL